MYSTPINIRENMTGVDKENQGRKRFTSALHIVVGSLALVSSQTALPR